MSFVNRDAFIAARLYSEYNGLKLEIKRERIHSLIQVLTVRKIVDISKQSKRKLVLKSVKGISLY